MAQNRDRTWQDRDQQQGRGGRWQGGEEFGQGEHGQPEGSGPQQGGEWNRMGRYGEEGRQGGGTGRHGEGGNDRMDRDFGSRERGSRGGYGTSQGQRDDQQRGFWDRASDEVSSWLGDEQARRRREMDEHRGRGPKGYTRSDERIREDVSDRFTDDGWLDASDIEVQVSAREVTLTGQVNSREEKRRAEDIAEAISGVKHVQNNLRVKDRSAASSGGEGSTTQLGSGTTSGSRRSI